MTDVKNPSDDLITFAKDHNVTIKQVHSGESKNILELLTEKAVVEALQVRCSITYMLLA